MRLGILTGGGHHPGLNAVTGGILPRGGAVPGASRVNPPRRPG